MADAQTSSISDIDILNFALNLEFLESEFYTYATTGFGIAHFQVPVTGSGTQGSVTGGAQVPFSTSNSTIRRLALELAADERAHVTLLQNTNCKAGH
jgi:rubrerythrin